MTLKIGIVGGGTRGRLFAEALATREDVKVIGVADPLHDQLEWTRDIHTYPDHSTLLDAGVDALIIATPDFAHHEAVLAAAERCVPMLVEKPLTTDLKQAEELVEACNDLPVMIGFENRWNPLVRATHSALAASGPVQWQTVELSNTKEVPLQMLSWASSSSPAWFLMPHSIDLAMWTAGDQVVEVNAITSSGLLKAEGIDTIDWIQAMLRFASGGSALVTSSWVLPANTEPIVEFRYAANSASASVRVDVIRGDSDLAGPDGHDTLAVEQNERNGISLSAPAAMVHEFADSLLAGAPLQPGIAHGYEVTRVISSILKSAEQGKPVKL